MPTVKYRLTNLAGTLLLAVGCWEALVFASGGRGIVSLSELFPALGNTVASINFWGSLAFTLAASIVGLIAGTIVALIVGVPLGSHRLLEVSSRGSINFLRSIPTVILLPLLLASMGSRVSVVVTLVVLAVALKMFVYVVRGVRDLNAELGEQARLLRLPLLTQVALIRFPAASALIVTGMRMAVNRAYGAVILAGLLAGTPGLGQEINLAGIRGDDSTLLAYVVIAGLVSVFLYQGFVWAERRVVHWRVVA